MKSEKEGTCYCIHNEKRNVKLVENILRYFSSITDILEAKIMKKITPLQRIV